jgi:uncharacterized protein (TIGR00251 family)
MKISVIAKAGAKHDKVEKLDEKCFRVAVKAPPEDGQANEAVLKLLAEYFHRPVCNFKLLSGHRSKNKIVGFD